MNTAYTIGTLRRSRTLLCLSLLCLLWGWSGAVVAVNAGEVIERTLSARADGEVSIRNVAGLVEVRGWDRAEVQLIARLGSPEQQLEVEETRTGIAINVREAGEGRTTRTSPATLQLQVPRGSRLQIHGVSADVSVADVRGDHHVQTVSGDIEISGFGPELRVRAVSGNIRLRGQEQRGRIEAANVSGDIVLIDAVGELEGSVVSGNLRVEGGRFDRLRINSVSGDMSGAFALAPDGRLEANSVSGALTATLQRDVQARFDLQSVSGRIEDCDGQRAEPARRFGPGQRLSFTQGEGGAVVSAQSMSGRIAICYR